MAAGALEAELTARRLPGLAVLFEAQVLAIGD
jgi:hypothetical protein